MLFSFELGRLHWNLADQQPLLELRRARKDFAARGDDQRVAVKDELILAADLAAEGDGHATLACSFSEHLLARGPFTGLKRRRREVHDQASSGSSLIALGRARGPNVFADTEPNQCAVQIDQSPATARREIAVLIEDSVIWQQVFAVAAADQSVREHSG